MRYLACFCALLFCSVACSKSDHVCSVAELSIQRRLAYAERECARWEAELERLTVELRHEKVAHIAHSVDLFERSLMEVEDVDSFVDQRLDELFVDERECLCEIMDAADSSQPEAQVVLDRILRIITELSSHRVR